MDHGSLRVAMRRLATGSRMEGMHLFHIAAFIVSTSSNVPLGPSTDAPRNLEAAVERYRAPQTASGREDPFDGGES